jgi:long-chain acyl-CoA synthetase
MESSTATTEAPRGRVEAKTMVEAFRHTAEQHPDQVAIRTKGGEFEITWAQLRDRVYALAGGLAKLGVGKGDSVALMIGNRPEFHLADLAVMTLGATPFSIYQTYTPEQIEYLVKDADARVAIVEQAYLDRVKEARKSLPALEHVILIDGEGDDTLALSEVEGSNPEFDPEDSIRQIEPEDVLTLIYTSGTTGPPKGVQLSHRNIIAVCETIEELIELEPGSRVISWLPAAHIAERNAHHYIPIVFAGEITTCDNPREIISYLPDVRPNWFFAVPRIWEKLKSGLETMLAGLPDDQREKSQRAIDDAREKVRLEQAGKDVPAELDERVRKADEELFSNLRVHLGLDQVKTVNVGAAPTPVEVLEFFHAIGIELAELWGMSETCGAGTVNPPGKVKIGTVGPPSPGVEIKLAEDGEVLVRGEIVMLGYRNQPDKTAETIDDDGWLRTGDIGELDDDGYLKIVDRKKELIINAAGKNMSPANIEGTVKSCSKLIGQVAVIGDRRPYNTALVTLDPEYAAQWAEQQGIEGDLAALAEDDRVREAVQADVDTANEKLARVEQVKKFTILPEDWEPGGDELTPTMKLKRKPIDEKHSEAIEAMYAR